MKVTVNVECSPEEARAFLGLPDVAPMQRALMSKIEEQLRLNMQTMNPASMFKAWLPNNMQNVEQAQKAFWSQFQETMNGLTASTSHAMLSFADHGDKR